MKYNFQKLAIILLLISIISLITGATIFTSFGGFDIITHEINNEKYQDITGISSIEIFSGNPDINIIPTEDKQIKVVLKGKIETNLDEKTPEIEIVKNLDTLKIGIERDDRLNGVIVIHNEYLTMDIYLPTSYNDNINIQTYSGDIKAKKFEMKNIKIESSSGDIIGDSLLANEILIATHSGDLNFKKIDSNELRMDTSSSNILIETIISDKTNINTYSGRINIDAINSDNIRITSSSGSMNLKDIESTEFKCNTYSGDIIIENFVTDELSCESSSGDFMFENYYSKNTEINTYSGSVDIEYYQFEDELEVDGNSGAITLTMPEKSEFQLIFDTATGDLQNDFPITIRDINDDRFEGKVGESENYIKIKTYSADLNLKN